MKTFDYKARNAQGEAIHDSLSAESEKDANAKLFELGLIPIEIRPRAEISMSTVLRPFRDYFYQQVSLEDLLIFNRQFQTVYSTGMPLLKGLTVIADEIENPYFKSVLKQIIGDIGNGQSIESAFAKFPKIFDATYVNLLKAGAASGKLEQILERISLLSEQKAENRERVKSALLYPKIVLFVLVAVFVTIVYFVIPKLKTFYDQFGAKLPGITQGLITFSNFMVHEWYIVLGIIGLSYYSFQRFVTSPSGRIHWHGLLLRLPIVGKILRLIETNSFCSVLELLVAGGLPILDALWLTRESLRNAIFQREIDSIRREVEGGGMISNGLRQSALFPPLVSSLVRVGEEAGALEMVLNRIANYYRVQINYRIANLSKTIEPLLLVLIFGAVLILALGVFLPIWKMSALLKTNR